MATTTSITTTYAGEFAGEYISAALLSGNTLENGGITIKPNVKHKEVIKKISTDTLIKDATCDFDPTSTVTLAERILQPTELQVNLQLCKKDFHSDWEAAAMGYSAFDNLPPKFSDFLLGHVAAKVAQKTEQTIWAGAAANAGEFGGFVELLTADADVTDVAAVGGGVNSGNVVAQLGAIVDAVPSTLYGNEDMAIYVSQNIAKAYVRALGGFATNVGASGIDAQGTQWYTGGTLSFDGIRLFTANGLANNTAVAAEKSNLFFGTGLMSDQNEVKVIDMADIDGSQNVRVVMRYTAGVQYGIGGDIVLYS
tara:strand:- start:994 stop:1923 length:930 start_codon:yes stop_codon:yes gene_type:complete